MISPLPRPTWANHHKHRLREEMPSRLHTSSAPARLQRRKRASPPSPMSSPHVPAFFGHLYTSENIPCKFSWKVAPSSASVSIQRIGTSHKTWAMERNSYSKTASKLASNIKYTKFMHFLSFPNHLSWSSPGINSTSLPVVAQLVHSARHPVQQLEGSQYLYLRAQRYLHKKS